MQRIITNNEKETFDFGLKLGRNCSGGEVFALIGDLGAGKTKLVQGLAYGLGIRQRVNSPTFNILKIYNSGSKIKNFCHIDAYRLESARDLTLLGVKEFFDSSTMVVAIEWADKVRKIWPKSARRIRIRSLSEDRREIIFS